MADFSYPIRACVADNEYRRFFTWFSNDMVAIWTRTMEISQIIHDISTLSEFNALLAEHGIQAIGSGRRRKQEREQRELFEVVF